jgi:hypothetical protein
MHTEEEYVSRWVEYSSRDAEVTFFLFYTLVNQLRGTPTVFGKEGM